ncbi:MAG: DUF3990 domain-containing protein [Cellulosilyticaceae bacterium]
MRAEIEENNRLTKFIFHQDTILAELDTEDTIKVRLIRWYGIVAANINGMDNNYYYHQDEQGSTAIITDENADIKNSYHYDALGKILESQEALPNRITYTGQQYDPSGYAKQEPPCKAPAVTDADGVDGKGTGEATQEHVTLYHATSVDVANSIRKNGVDLNHVTRDMDFGRGFYTTIDKNQALDWIRVKFKGIGDIAEFKLSKNEIDSLNNKVFSSADAELENFVRNSRNGMTNSYDTVSGPMLRNPIKKFYEGSVPAKSSGQQTAFNTQDAIDLLNKYMQGE